MNFQHRNNYNVQYNKLLIIIYNGNLQVLKYICIILIRETKKIYLLVYGK